MQDVGLYWLEDGEQVECNMNVLLDESWEIDIPYVNFWTAWQAANEGWAIKSEFREYPIVVDDITAFNKREISGRWQIIK